LRIQRIITEQELSKTLFVTKNFVISKNPSMYCIFYASCETRNFGSTKCETFPLDFLLSLA